MDTLELGRKIKEARLGKKMTQSEVVGNFITRNMLSQIESGAATPSMKTLTYLCDILSLPIENLMGDRDTEANPLTQLVQAKQSLAAGNYSQVIQLSEDYPSLLTDEFSALLAQAYLGLAKELADKREYEKVPDLIKKSTELADQGIYSNSELKTNGILFLNKIADDLKQYYLNLNFD